MFRNVYQTEYIIILHGKQCCNAIPSYYNLYGTACHVNTRGVKEKNSGKILNRRPVNTEKKYKFLTDSLYFIESINSTPFPKRRVYCTKPLFSFYG